MFLLKHYNGKNPKVELHQCDSILKEVKKLCKNIQTTHHYYTYKDLFKYMHDKRPNLKNSHVGNEAK